LRDIPPNNCWNGACLHSKFDELTGTKSHNCPDEVPLELVGNATRFIKLIAPTDNPTADCKKGLFGKRKNLIEIKPPENEIDLWDFLLPTQSAPLVGEWTF